MILQRMKRILQRKKSEKIVNYPTVNENLKYNLLTQGLFKAIDESNQ